MNVREYVTRRLALLVLVLFGVSLITFYLSRGIPGISPIAAYVTQDTPPSQYKQIANRYHLNDPLYLQYWYYMSDLFHGDLGFSRSANLPVATAVSSFLPATAELAVFAFVISILIGVPLGIYAAIRVNKFQDTASRTFALFSFSAPVFWVGLLLQLFLFYYLKVSGLPFLPSGGRISPEVALDHPVMPITGSYILDSVITGNWVFFWDALSHLILPSITLSLPLIALFSRIVRVSMLDALNQSYILLARSKGIPERVVLLKHALRNVLLPLLTLMGLSIAYLLSGSIVTETVFAWPGMGRWVAGAINADDTAAIMAFAIIAATIFVLTNLIVDLLYAVADPRVKYGGGERM